MVGCQAYSPTIFIALGTDHLLGIDGEVMCLPFNDIEAYLHYYAGRFQNNRFEHDELVNEAWIAINGLTIPQFASAGIRWAMQSYMNHEYRQDHRGNTTSVIQSIDDEIKEGLFYRNLLIASKDKRSQVKEDAEYAYCLLQNPNINLRDRLLIDQRYFQGLTLTQIAKIHGCSVGNITFRLRKIVNILKDVAGAA